MRDDAVLEELVKAVDVLSDAVKELARETRTSNAHNYASRASTAATRAKRALRCLRQAGAHSARSLADRSASTELL